ncbi:ABC-2 type transport system permease protein [Paenibacillus phyllosphaerae]|uniref:ABC-2 type transport system permease protein n=1 Tax=Paenibacillus phyllosphaerae TaxID=274593 RepID=A0A7W5AU10_9BACL|nr:ABC-2 family transporter protein [Paenibacillus phyllosphaerae]MBB3108126.1 ABC-2 type transport system permease protein [Paenibacillus phyllosphaerae]
MNVASKYVRTFILGLQNALTYRANFMLSLASCVFPILIQFFLWRSVFNSTDQEIVYGYTFSQMIAYVILSALAGKLVATGFEYEISNDIKTGQLSKFSVQPISYFLFRGCVFIGEKVVQLIILFLVFVAVIVALHVYLDFSIQIGQVLLFIGFIPLSLLLNFMIYYCLAALGFWFIEVWGIYHTFSLVAMVVGGGVFPLDVFGDSIQRVVLLLPFQYTIFHPISIVTGKIDLQAGLSGVWVVLGWIAVLFLLSKWAWRKGMKRFESVGG